MDARTRERLRQHWHSLLHRFAAEEAAKDEAFADIARRYGEPARHYHTLDHVNTVYEWALELIPDWGENRELLLAAFLHDVIYDTRAHNNEELSAEYADGLLMKLGAPAEVREEVSRLILVTKFHEAPKEDGQACALIDADLAILSADEAKYDAYAAAIRREYDWVPDADYRKGRAKVLRQFLARARIYRDVAWHEHRDPGARANLTRELATLEGSR